VFVEAWKKLDSLLASEIEILVIGHIALKLTHYRRNEEKQYHLMRMLEMCWRKTVKP
tara:strand:+ start:732 stop:902 length:171 start_codon:yes stop_codon:yes gene_type:complete